MITTINEFKKSLMIKENPTPEVLHRALSNGESQAMSDGEKVWHFHEPNDRSQFIDVNKFDQKKIMGILNQEWPALHPGIQGMVNNWVSYNPIGYNAMTQQSSWKNYFDSQQVVAMHNI